MRKHWRYLKYVFFHKLYVAQACFDLGIPWAGIVHDWSKFLPDEWGPYAEYFYGKGSKDAKTAVDFDYAWLKHLHRNPHHWQHWVLRLDSGQTQAMMMPERYMIEMLADWKGAGKEITGKENVLEWYMKNRDKMVLNPGVRGWIEMTIGVPKDQQEWMVENY